MLRGFATRGLPERKGQRAALALIAGGLALTLLPAALCLAEALGAPGWLP